MKSLILSVTAMTLLGACNLNAPILQDAPIGVQRLVAQYQDHPFDTGPITVLAEEHGELRSFTLRACGDAHVCGARRGHLTTTQDHYVVTGAYAGRVFYISPGGDGMVKRGGAFHPIAWN